VEQSVDFPLLNSSAYRYIAKLKTQTPTWQTWQSANIKRESRPLTPTHDISGCMHGDTFQSHFNNTHSITFISLSLLSRNLISASKEIPERRWIFVNAKFTPHGVESNRLAAIGGTSNFLSPPPERYPIHHNGFTLARVKIYI
jgi:hypothetical protein